MSPQQTKRMVARLFATIDSVESRSDVIESLAEMVSPTDLAAYVAERESDGDPTCGTCQIPSSKCDTYPVPCCRKCTHGEM